MARYPLSTPALTMEQEPQALPDMITPSELSDYTRISMSTLANWRSRGLGPKFQRLSNRVRYSRDDVQAWLAESLKQGVSKHER